MYKFNMCYMKVSIVIFDRVRNSKNQYQYQVRDPFQNKKHESTAQESLGTYASNCFYNKLHVVVYQSIATFA